MAIYGDRAYLHLAKVNISQQLTYYQQQLAVVNEEIELTQPHQKKRLKKLEEQKSSLERYIVDFETFETSSPEDVVIAGILSISHGNVMEMLYAGMNEAFKNAIRNTFSILKSFKMLIKMGLLGRIWEV